MGTLLSCRRVRQDDAELLWRWANDPDTRRHAFSTAPIPWSDHAAWLQRRLTSPATSMWLFIDGATPIGQVRFDLTGDAAEISLSVAPEHRRRGYGSQMLTLALERLHAEHGDRVRPRASVLEHNAASRALFASAGFAAVMTVGAPGDARAIVFERPVTTA